MNMKKGWIRQEHGQSLILVVFAIIALVAFVGLAVDLGLSYVERVRVRRAADAAALAAAAELPLENAAQVRALEYLAQNDYDCGLTATASGTGNNAQLNYTCNDPTVRVEINLNSPYTSDRKVFGPDASVASRIIRINTYDYRPTNQGSAPDTADRIRVEITQQVAVFFMRVLGFTTVPVNGQATAENINNLDVVLVFDKSGSMEFDTLCYGCWTPKKVSGVTVPYPDGNRYPLPWGGPANGPATHCSGSGSPIITNTYTYKIIEAEEYTRISNPYDRDTYAVGRTYWVLQRNGTQTGATASYMGNAGALGRDSYGAYISHAPYRNHTQSDDGTGSNCSWTDLNNPDPINGRVCLRDSWTLSVGGPYQAPRADYDFKVPSAGTWYVWVRGQGGDAGDNLMWGLNGTPLGDVSGFGSHSLVYNGANYSYWRWRRLGSMSGLNTSSTYTLNIWAGAAGFDLDRIIITTDSRDPSSFFNSGSETPLSQYTTFVNTVMRNTTKIDNNRTGWACDVCDPRFGGYPGGTGGTNPPNCTAGLQPYRYLDWLYDDEQPIRGTKEAAKKFLMRLDYRFDQAGLVTYSSNASTVSELQCLRRLGSTSCTPQVVTDTVISKLDAVYADGATNIPQAILYGIDVLSTKTGHYGRPGAAHIMILMTDGEANTYSGVDSACYAQDYWPGATGDTSYDRAKDCVVYYARQARNNGIVIYTITLGAGADTEVMQYVAELTGGVHRHAPRPEQLDPIFDELYKRIFLRLIE